MKFGPEMGKSNSSKFHDFLSKVLEFSVNFWR
jgi:hypothetical protein